MDKARITIDIPKSREHEKEAIMHELAIKLLGQCECGDSLVKAISEHNTEFEGREAPICEAESIIENQMYDLLTSPIKDMKSKIFKILGLEKFLDKNPADPKYAYLYKALGDDEDGPMLTQDTYKEYFKAKYKLDLDKLVTFDAAKKMDEILSKMSPEYFKDEAKVVTRDLGDFRLGRWVEEEKTMYLKPEIFNSELIISPESKVNLGQKVLAHELGHKIDHEYEYSKNNKWREISGWTKKETPDNIQCHYNMNGLWKVGKWHHDKTAAFINEYASRNPKEDFAESFSYAVIGLDQWFTVKECEEKQEFMKQYVLPDDIVLPNVKQATQPGDVEIAKAETDPEHPKHYIMLEKSVQDYVGQCMSFRDGNGIVVSIKRIKAIYPADDMFGPGTYNVETEAHGILGGMTSDMIESLISQPSDEIGTIAPVEKALGQERVGHKYIKRIGAFPGPYKYIYTDEQNKEYESEEEPSHIKEWASQPGEYTAYRTGGLDTKRGGIFFGRTAEEVKPYENLAEGRTTKKYTVKIENPLVIDKQYQAMAKLFKVDVKEVFRSRDRAKNQIEWLRAADKKIANEARRQGYDSILYTNPMPPAEKELIALDKSKIKEMQTTEQPSQQQGKETEKALGDQPIVPGRVIGQERPGHRYIRRIRDERTGKWKYIYEEGQQRQPAAQEQPVPITGPYAEKMRELQRQQGILPPEPDKPAVKPQEQPIQQPAVKEEVKQPEPEAKPIEAQPEYHYKGQTEKKEDFVRKPEYDVKNINELEKIIKSRKIASYSNIIVKIGNDKYYLYVEEWWTGCMPFRKLGDTNPDKIRTYGKTIAEQETGLKPDFYGYIEDYRDHTQEMLTEEEEKEGKKEEYFGTTYIAEKIKPKKKQATEPKVELKPKPEAVQPEPASEEKGKGKTEERLPPEHPESKGQGKIETEPAKPAETKPAKEPKPKKERQPRGEAKYLAKWVDKKSGKTLYLYPWSKPKEMNWKGYDDIIDDIMQNGGIKPYGKHSGILGMKVTKGDIWEEIKQSVPLWMMRKGGNQLAEHADRHKMTESQLLAEIEKARDARTEAMDKLVADYKARVDILGESIAHVRPTEVTEAEKEDERQRLDDESGLENMPDPTEQDVLTNLDEAAQEHNKKMDELAAIMDEWDDDINDFMNKERAQGIH